MRVEAESWDNSGGIGTVGARSFKVTAETQNEAAIVAGLVAQIMAGFREGGATITNDGSELADDAAK